jgi:hypothetical protein
MKGRWWMIVGVVAGVAVSVGHLPYLAGAARSLANTAQRLVASGGHHLITEVASHGAPQRVVLGSSAVVALLVPGATALLLVVAAKGTLRLRRIVALILVALGAATFFYQPHGSALGALVLAFAAAGIAVALSGPVLVAPLCALAGLIGGEYLPHLLSRHPTVPHAVVSELHQALLSNPGAPAWLRVAALVVAVAPFAVGIRLVLSRST